MHNFKRQFGQNFLKNINAAFAFVDVARITEEEEVLEIGPGDGAITEILLQTAKSVTCVEIDPELITSLSEKFANYPNFKLIHADFLQFDLEDFLQQHPKTKIIGALPYNISKQIIKKIITAQHLPLSATFIIQKELAKKYTSVAPKADFLSIYASAYCTAEYVASIPREAFFPMPKVEGGVLHMYDFYPRCPQEVLKLVRLGYAAPRKKLSSNLANVGHTKESIESTLLELGKSASARAGELSLDEWKSLYHKISDALPN